MLVSLFREQKVYSLSLSTGDDTELVYFYILEISVPETIHSNNRCKMFTTGTPSLLYGQLLFAGLGQKCVVIRLLSLTPFLQKREVRHPMITSKKGE